MSGSGRDILLEVWEYLGGPHGSPVVGGRISRMSGSGREILLEVQE